MKNCNLIVQYKFYNRKRTRLFISLQNKKAVVFCEAQIFNLFLSTQKNISRSLFNALTDRLMTYNILMSIVEIYF